MSCASYIAVSPARPRPPRRTSSQLQNVDEHAAFIGLQALTLNLASANRLSESSERSGSSECTERPERPEQIERPRQSAQLGQTKEQKPLKPLTISTARRTPEKHVSISPQSICTPRSQASSTSPPSRGRPSPSRSESSGFHSLPSPDGSACSSEGSSGCCGGQRGRLFTNHCNMEVKPSDSLDSVNTRASGQSRHNTRPPRHGAPTARRGTPQSRHGTPQRQLRHGTPQNNRPHQGFDEYATIFDVQQGLQKGQLVEGVLRINPKSYKDAYISAPDGLTDIYVGGVRDRNRGLHGDVVAVQLRPPAEWRVLENALVTYLISDGSVADLETLYGTDENLQKHVSALDEILPERFPRPLRLGGGPAVSSTEDGAEKVAVKAVGTQKVAVVDGAVLDGPVEGPGGASSGDESDDVVVESVTVDAPEDGAKEGAAEPTAPVDSSGDAETAVAEAAAAGEIAGEAETADAGDQAAEDGEQAEDGSQKPRRGTRAGKARRRRQKQSVAARLAALSLGEPATDGVSDEREDCAKPSSSGGKTGGPSPAALAAAAAAGGQAAQSSAAAAAEGACDSAQARGVDGVNSECKRGVSGESVKDECVEDGSAVDAAKSATDSAKKRNRRPAQTPQKTPQKSASGGTPQTPRTPQKPGTPQTPRTPSGRGGQGAAVTDGSALGVTVQRALTHADWGRFVQRTAKVVHILEPKHPRRAVGELRMFPDSSRHQALFAPRDHRVPRLKVAAADCPADFFQQPQLYARTLFMAEITDWSEPNFARGKLSQLLGETGSVDVEMEAILMEHGIDTREFGPQDMHGLPTAPWTIPEEEIQRRRDFRKECVFTIDPLTARDLDDAVSCRRLESGDYEVGVHIADVSYFLRPGVAADLTAAQRCNSVYLVHKVIPMLPRLLCEDLCSLNPSEDRLAFSVVWTLDAEGRVFEEWFGRTVIRSCTKLAYEHAQRIIENPDKEPTEEDLPPIDGTWSRSDIASRVLVLHKMAQCMRQRRTDDGALRLDQPKLCFQLDGPNGAPTGFYTYNQQDSNRLIEEFMLLANMAVAARILRSFPALSVLRRHAPPQEGPLADAARLLRGVGLDIDAETSGALHDSLQAMAAAWEQELSADEARARMAVVVNLLSRPMNPAEYFCSGVLTDAAQYRHYALSVPLYTHFTSPIRRYPDVLVHRLLADALKCDKHEPLPPNIVQRICVRCNEKKLSARLCSESCALLFLAHMIDLCGPLRQPAVVMAVLDKSFDVFIPEMAVSRRVYIDKLEVESVDFTKASGGVPRLRLTWKATETEPAIEQTLQLFTPVVVSLEATDIPLKFSTVALRPGTELPPADAGGATERRCVITAELDEV